ncbi:2-oxo-tetronate isomerase [Roseiterribacter gracilis]|uniref:Hydroxypyruvate isomerase n=1 Tax=Roseiterribacter gracilis TaxID=2812848 RepID=A0A8S8XJF4_9PROT|nr:hydroxypyruvate isomerase [Rhodospirillales bacterium TMPK1]
MIRLAANLSFLFPELDFLDRFDAAAACGFTGVEFLFPYAHPADAILSRLHRNDLAQVVFNLPPGDWDAGERGIAALPGREAEFRDGVTRALDLAAAFGTRHLHAMAGIVPKDVDPGRLHATYLANLAHAAEAARPYGINITIEAINRNDMPGYYVEHTDAALQVVAQVGLPNLRLQFDLYHRQRTEGELLHGIDRCKDVMAHVQIAGAPHRNEPEPSEINYDTVFAHLDAVGYDGWIGCEYRPRNDTRAGLDWARRRGFLPA